MNVVYFQTKTINPKYCERGTIPENDPEYIWYLEDLKKVLGYAFPEDITNSEGTFKFYYKIHYYNELGCSDIINAPTHSVKEFLKPENEYPKVMNVSKNPIKTKEDFKTALS